MSEPLRVLAFPGAPNLPVFAAMAHGYFENRGLSIAFDTTPSSVFQFEQLAAGNVDIAMTAFDNVVAYAEGQGAVSIPADSDYRAILGATQIELSFITAPDVTQYDDLKGRSIALDALATGFAFVLYEMLERNGISRDDVTLAAVGSTPDRWQSVREGTHAGTLGIEPFTSIARAAGFTILDQSSSLLSAYQGGIIASSARRAENDEQRTRGFLAAYLDGLRWSLDPTNYDDAKALLLERMPAIKPGVVDAVMSSLLDPRSGLTPNGEFLGDGIAAVLRLRSKYGGGDTLTEPQVYLDTRFSAALA